MPRAARLDGRCWLRGRLSRLYEVEKRVSVVARVVATKAIVVRRAINIACARLGCWRQNGAGVGVHMDVDS